MRYDYKEFNSVQLEVRSKFSFHFNEIERLADDNQMTMKLDEAIHYLERAILNGCKVGLKSVPSMDDLSDKEKIIKHLECIEALFFTLEKSGEKDAFMSRIGEAKELVGAESSPGPDMTEHDHMPDDVA